MRSAEADQVVHAAQPVGGTRTCTTVIGAPFAVLTACLISGTLGEAILAPTTKDP